MNHRERILAAVGRRPTDILPVGFKASDDVLRRLQGHFGVTDVRALVRALPVDTYGVFNNCLHGIYPAYCGDSTRVLYPSISPDGTWDTIYGYRRRWHAFAGGHSDEVIDHPLEHAESLADLQRYSWPRADEFDYSTIARQCAAVDEYAILFLAGGLGHVANLLGFERTLMDMALHPELLEYCHGALGEFFVELTDRTLRAAQGRIDIICVQDDFGTQSGKLISLEMYRRFFTPYHRRLFEVAKRHGARVMQHSCGAVFDFIPDFIEIGVDILDPIQTTAVGMDPRRLKEDFGKDLCFHGGIDVQNILVRGTAGDVRRHLDELVETLGRDGGFILAPSHYIQGDAPWANVLTIFDHVTKWR
jgi:uroporphyrinogen decarboxylase